MREMFATSIFLKDLQREYSSFAKSEKNLNLRQAMATVLGRLLFDVNLEIHHKDHKLTGNWSGFRDCHVFNDLVLIYRKYDKKDGSSKYGDHALVLARLGSHSALDL